MSFCTLLFAQKILNSPRWIRHLKHRMQFQGRNQEFHRYWKKKRLQNSKHPESNLSRNFLHKVQCFLRKRTPLSFVISRWISFRQGKAEKSLPYQLLMNGYVNKKQCWWVMLCEIGLDIMPNIIKSQEDIRRMYSLIKYQEVPFQIPTKIETHFELQINQLTFCFL